MSDNLNVDLMPLIIGDGDSLEVKVKVQYDQKMFSNTAIRELKNAKFVGAVKKLYDDRYNLFGTISGVMVLADDITLEDVEYDFSCQVDEDFTFGLQEDDGLMIVQNKLDLSEFIWQNILLEVPSKIKNQHVDDFKMKGSGWRLTTEEELKKEVESPFSDLLDKF